MVYFTYGTCQHQRIRHGMDHKGTKTQTSLPCLKCICKKSYVLRASTVFCLFFAGRSFAYVAHFVFLRDVWIRTQRAAVASRRTTNLDEVIHAVRHSHEFQSDTVLYSHAICSTTMIESKISRGQRHTLRDRRPSTAACPACWAVGTKVLK
jgi:hypothetical protein